MGTAAQSLLSELERLTDEAALAIETATTTQLDVESCDELRQVTSDEVRFQHKLVSRRN